MNILHIDSSPMFETSNSRKLSAMVVALLQERYPGCNILHKDLARDPPPHLTQDVYLAYRRPEAELTPQQRRERAVTDAHIEQFLASDIVVIGAPLYNLSLPTQLKAWIDRISQPGRTFRYAERGIVGLVSNVRVIVASSRGGLYSLSEEGRARDFQERYLLAALKTLGIAHIDIVRVEGVNMSADRRAEAYAKAQAAADDIVSSILASRPQWQRAALV
ncbi:FMN-dependent NADH-azoreductase [Variovorax terrae]|uniref:FMN dependent NADH:quinone oxidoreductase n=1 Tax=Variovorax terrae TaxID=2923278 RepID=A0A9X2AQW3_9BURK|nr:NAD(P)H-dependent oxidoreductase [Variovorax terrae]MCJ0764917.1 NAD(P)H-dependent oxidoreductase [Variovorax terrae]